MTKPKRFTPAEAVTAGMGRIQALAPFEGESAQDVQAMLESAEEGGWSATAACARGNTISHWNGSKLVEALGLVIRQAKSLSEPDIDVGVLEARRSGLRGMLRQIVHEHGKACIVPTMAHLLECIKNQRAELLELRGGENSARGLLVEAKLQRDQAKLEVEELETKLREANREMERQKDHQDALRALAEQASNRAQGYKEALEAAAAGRDRAEADARRFQARYRRLSVRYADAVVEIEDLEQKLSRRAPLRGELVPFRVAEDLERVQEHDQRRSDGSSVDPAPEAD